MRADRAIAFDPSHHVQRRMFEHWQRTGVIHEEGTGRYWLDVIAYDLDQRRRHNRLRIVLLVIVGMLVVGVVTGLLTVHRPRKCDGLRRQRGPAELGGDVGVVGGSGTTGGSVKWD